MTGKKFLLFLFLSLVIFTPLKIWFFDNQIFSNAGIQQIIFWVLTGVIATALVRRFGIISFLEAFFIMVVWTLAGLLADVLVTSTYTGLGIFYGHEYWYMMLVMNASIFILHKKRHIHVRHELHAIEHAKKHAAEHGAGQEKKH